MHKLTKCLNKLRTLQYDLSCNVGLSHYKTFQAFCALSIMPNSSYCTIHVYTCIYKIKHVFLFVLYPEEKNFKSVQLKMTPIKKDKGLMKPQLQLMQHEVKTSS